MLVARDWYQRNIYPELNIYWEELPPFIRTTIKMTLKGNINTNEFKENMKTNIENSLIQIQFEE